MACSNCGSEYHNKTFCPWTKKKPIKQQGKATKKWLATRSRWIKENPPDWYCYICGKHLNKATLTLDHIKPRSARPDLRYEFSNLAPCCSTCNYLKGSKH